MGTKSTDYPHEDVVWSVSGFKQCECGSTKFSFNNEFTEARCDSCGLIHKPNSKKAVTRIFNEQ